MMEMLIALFLFVFSVSPQAFEWRQAFVTAVSG